MVTRREPYGFRPDDSPDPPATQGQDPPPADCGIPAFGRVKDRNDVKVFNYKHAIPVHTASASSILAKEAPPQSYRGFMNLASKLTLCWCILS